MKEREWTRVLGWPGYQVYAKEIDEPGKKLKLWVRRKKAGLKLICSGCGQHVPASRILGQRKKAAELVQRAAESARRQKATEAAASLVANDPVEDALAGYCHGSQTIVSALCRDVGMAQKLIDSSVNPIAAQTLYLRGLNFLRARKGMEAAAEFQKLLDHKGANWGPYYPAAYVRLARATSLVGDMHRGKKSYEDFLALWKEADAEIPWFIQARAEYTVLK